MALSTSARHEPDPLRRLSRGFYHTDRPYSRTLPPGHGVCGEEYSPSRLSPWSIRARTPRQPARRAARAAACPRHHGRAPRRTRGPMRPARPPAPPPPAQPGRSRHHHPQSEPAFDIAPDAARGLVLAAPSVPAPSPPPSRPPDTFTPRSGSACLHSVSSLHNTNHRLAAANSRDLNCTKRPTSLRFFSTSCPGSGRPAHSGPRSTQDRAQSNSLKSLGSSPPTGSRNDASQSTCRLSSRASALTTPHPPAGRHSAVAPAAPGSRRQPKSWRQAAAQQYPPSTSSAYHYPLVVYSHPFLHLGGPPRRRPFQTSGPAPITGAPPAEALRHLQSPSQARDPQPALGGPRAQPPGYHGDPGPSSLSARLDQCAQRERCPEYARRRAGQRRHGCAARRPSASTRDRALRPGLSGSPSRQHLAESQLFDWLVSRATVSGQDPRAYASTCSTGGGDGEREPSTSDAPSTSTSGYAGTARGGGSGGGGGGSGGKRGRRSAKGGDDGGRDDKPKRAPKKTAMACHFCRGRKLKCDGAKPSCGNCERRKQPCEYDDEIRRRGPGRKNRLRADDGGGGGGGDGGTGTGTGTESPVEPPLPQPHFPVPMHQQQQQPHLQQQQQQPPPPPPPQAHPQAHHHLQQHQQHQQQQQQQHQVPAHHAQAQQMAGPSGGADMMAFQQGLPPPLTLPPMYGLHPHPAHPGHAHQAHHHAAAGAGTGFPIGTMAVPGAGHVAGVPFPAPSPMVAGGSARGGFGHGHGGYKRAATRSPEGKPYPKRGAGGYEDDEDEYDYDYEEQQ